MTNFSFLSNLKLKRLQQVKILIALDDLENVINEITQLKDSLEFELGAISDLRENLEQILETKE